jgi:CheY-like chemotaxis protein
MTQTMPLYLIGVGVVLIFALAYLLLKMRKRDRKEGDIPKGADSGAPATTSEPDTVPASESEAPAVEPMEEEAVIEEKPAPPPPAREKAPSLPVCSEAFAETPGIDRTSFDAFSGKHVLVVEDNPVNRKLILTLMAGSGIELDSAEDGVEALEKLRAPGAAYDLVLMDVNMPRMDGLECTEEIRRDPALKEIPVLALTASTTPEEVERILDSGMNGYLDKPLNLGKLYTAFVSFMEEYRVPREASSADAGPETDSAVLDTKVGLEHTNNDSGLYRMLLQDFLQQYADSPSRFRKMVEAKDFESLHRLVIDLEGLTGMLGAMELYQLLLEVNRILGQGTTMLLIDYAEEYAHAFTKVEKEMERYLAG